MKKKIPWKKIIETLHKELETSVMPSVSQIAEDGRQNPYKVLVSTVISLRTKDEVTLEASRRLFKQAGTPQKLEALSVETIEKLIYPAGFYKTKAKNLKEIASILQKKYNGRVPDSREALLELPGVGRKTANLVLNLGYGINAICVDTHVHRISNRFGWVKTKNADKTELALVAILPEEYWIPINELLVRFGQNICHPISPACSRCPVESLCEKVGVTKSR